MSDQFVGEIRIVAFNFPPTGWAYCNGQLLPLSQNTALFSLLGTYYGGNGMSNFALPDLQGKAPIHQGQGQGLTDRMIGEEGGSEFVTLLESEIPAHSHSLWGSGENGTQGSLTSSVALGRSRSGLFYQTTTNANLVAMNAGALAPAGSDLPHNNMQPYLVMNFIIALQGVYPPRQ